MIKSMLYLDSNDVTPVDIQPALHFGEKNTKPVADCLDIIWRRGTQIRNIKKERTHTVGARHTCISGAKYDVWFLK